MWDAEDSQKPQNQSSSVRRRTVALSELREKVRGLGNPGKRQTTYRTLARAVSGMGWQLQLSCAFLSSIGVHKAFGYTLQEPEHTAITQTFLSTRCATELKRRDPPFTPLVASNVFLVFSAGRRLFVFTGALLFAVELPVDEFVVALILGDPLDSLPRTEIDIFGIRQIVPHVKSTK